MNGDGNRRELLLSRLRKLTHHLTGDDVPPILTDDWLMDHLSDAICKGQFQESNLFAEALLSSAETESEKAVLDCVRKGCNKALNRFAENEFYVPELLLALRAAYQCRQHCGFLDSQWLVGRLAIGSLNADEGFFYRRAYNYHILPSATALRVADFAVYELGAHVSPTTVYSAIADSEVSIVALHSGYDYEATKDKLSNIVSVLEQVGVREQVRIMVMHEQSSGYTLGEREQTHKELVRAIRADGFWTSALNAAEVAKCLMATK